MTNLMWGDLVSNLGLGGKNPVAHGTVRHILIISLCSILVFSSHLLTTPDNLLPSDSPYQNSLHISIPSHAFHMPYPFHPLWSDTPSWLAKDFKSWSPSLCDFCTFLLPPPFRSTASPSAPDTTTRLFLWYESPNSGQTCWTRTRWFTFNEISVPLVRHRNLRWNGTNNSDVPLVISI